LVTAGWELDKEKEVREDTHLPADEPVLFLEVTVPDASEMALQRSAPYTWPSMANKL
jgi:hypothetical protein